MLRPVRRTLTFAVLIGLITALVFVGRRRGVQPATPLAGAREKSEILAQARRPKLPRWLTAGVAPAQAEFGSAEAEGDSDAATTQALLEAEKLAARAVEAAQATRRLADGTVAHLAATRPRFATGRPVELELELADAKGEPLSSRGDLELIIFGDDGADATKVGFVENPSAPGRYGASVDVSARTPGNLYAAASVPLSGADNPGKAAAAMLRVELEQGAEAALSDAPIADWSEGLSVRFQVEAKVAGPAAIKANLCDPSGNVLRVGQANAELTVGPNSVTLAFGDFDPASSGISAGNLWVADVVLFAGDPLRWTDFWAIPKPLSVPAISSK